ncbi:peroxiredoxin-like family protein [Oscillatoria sp. CS-180]|uniref:peroxiredoxin-like family protein n=1 Tax=Oscillatoria sp. CS-180 TaxID=3021720 RepID=UPI00232FAD83|nr:peroxiredoxin-like family protein [Oscillatoria sp. CS-180]MDB9527228.1 peroxiredoxin-like family protein [Oscillatoria sp. CS-180]
MSLTHDLAQLAGHIRAKLPEDTKATMAKAGDDITKLGIEDRSLKTGDTIPTVTLPNALGETVAVQTLLQDGPVVIAFYRGGWCPYCNMELRALQQALPKIEAQGARLVAISPETPDHSLSTKEKNDLTFEVLSDVGNLVAQDFGLVFAIPEYLRPVYKSFGIDVAAHNGDEKFELPVPATYVVDTSGKIAHAFVNLDYTQREDPENIVTALKSLQVTV